MHACGNLALRAIVRRHCGRRERHRARRLRQRARRPRHRALRQRHHARRRAPGHTVCSCRHHSCCSYPMLLPPLRSTALVCQLLAPAAPNHGSTFIRFRSCPPSPSCLWRCPPSLPQLPPSCLPAAAPAAPQPLPSCLSPSQRPPPPSSPPPAGSGCPPPGGWCSCRVEHAQDDTVVFVY